MKALFMTYLPFLLALFPGVLSERPPGEKAILLSNVQTLTLYARRMTWYNRVPPIHQLKCAGPSRICNLHEIDVMRCTNQGYDYDEEDVQWSCTASLPPEFKLGSTDVICEGYRDADDKWVLKGSCGVEYRLLLTEKGEERYGRQRDYSKSSKTDEPSIGWFGNILGWIIVVFIIWIVVYAACYGGNNGNRPGNNRRGWGGGGGRGDDPPPPYDYQPGPQYKRSDSGPGFWTGAAAGGAAGGAAGYAMGRRHNRQQETRAGPSYYHTRYSDLDRDEPRSSRSFSPPRDSTGFGSTRRR